MDKTHAIFALSLKGQIRGLIESSLPDSVGLVCDANTWNAAGRWIHGELGDACTLIMLATPEANNQTVQTVIEQASNCSSLLAVGSGTINDLCKRASFEMNLPYGVFATAPSMNGYNSANASICVDGTKSSLPAHTPQVVLCDLEVLANAPARLIRSGLGDSLCRSTAQADWLLSHMLWDIPYNQEAFNLLKPFEAELMASAGKLTSTDNIEVIKLLMQTLLASGDGMRLCGGSYPASQGEHMIAHTLEMMHGDKRPQTYHGEEIGVTTLTMARLHQRMLARNTPPQLVQLPNATKELTAHFDEHQALILAQSYANKRSYITKACHLDNGHKGSDLLNAINQRLQERWPEICEVISAITVETNTLEQALVTCGAPITPEALGWNSKDYKTSHSIAHLTRDRFTFLDLAVV